MWFNSNSLISSLPLIIRDPRHVTKNLAVVFSIDLEPQQDGCVVFCVCVNAKLKNEYVASSQRQVLIYDRRQLELKQPRRFSPVPVPLSWTHSQLIVQAEQLDLIYLLASQTEISQDHRRDMMFLSPVQVFVKKAYCSLLALKSFSDLLFIGILPPLNVPQVWLLIPANAMYVNGIHWSTIT